MSRFSEISAIFLSQVEGRAHIIAFRTVIGRLELFDESSETNDLSALPATSTRLRRSVTSSLLLRWKVPFAHWLVQRVVRLVHGAPCRLCILDAPWRGPKSMETLHAAC